jgi:hypothetical protein
MSTFPQFGAAVNVLSSICIQSPLCALLILGVNGKIFFRKGLC